jgi:2-polyprenyl-3-methyl-5-hydroxy-6-metoxy-1,4-benzoquinol methylase
MQTLIQDENIQHLSSIRIFQKPNCYLCGKPGRLIFSELQDRLYGVKGVWGLRECDDVKCQLVWLDPAPIEDDLGKAYLNYYTHQLITKSLSFQFRQQVKKGVAGLIYGYGSTTSFFEKLMGVPFLFTPFLRENMFATGCGYLNGQTRGKLLEIGCGSGMTLANLKNLGWDAEGIDFDSKAAESANLNFNLTVKSGSLKEVNYEANKFDAILMSHVIEHIFDPINFLTECSRILKPGGKLVILTPNINSIGFRRFSRNWVHLDPPRHLYLFSIQTLQVIAIKAGLFPTSWKTTVRDSNSSWIMSTEISKSGKWNSSKKIGLWRKIQAKIFQVIALVKLYINNDSGDEIVLILSKPANF